MRFLRDNSFKIRVLEEERDFDIEKPIEILIRVHLLIFAENPNQFSICTNVLNYVIEPGKMGIHNEALMGKELRNAIMNNQNVGQS